MKYTSIEHRTKRGIILLVVMGMLAVFSLLAISFLVFSGNSKSGSIALERPKQRGTPGDKLAEMVIQQVVRGTNDKQSPLFGHDLLQDVYGYQGVLSGAFGGIVDTSSATPPLQYGRALRIRLDTNRSAVFFSGNNRSSLISIPLNPAAMQHPHFRWNPVAPQTPIVETTALGEDYFTGRYLTFQQGALQGLTFRILRYLDNGPSDAQNRYRFVIDLSEPMAFPSVENGRVDQASLASNLPSIVRFVDGSGVTRPVEVFVNSAPYKGAGFGTQLTEVPPMSGNFQYGLTQNITQVFNPYSNTVEAISTNLQIPVTLLGRPGNFGGVLSGSTAEDFDVADFNDYYLSHRFENALSSTDPRDIIPSFHRPAVINYLYNRWFVSGGQDPNDLAVVTRFLSLLELVCARPLAINIYDGSTQPPTPRYVRNAFFNGGNSSTPRFELDVSSGIGPAAPLSVFLTALVQGPWDVDTNRDSVADSVWIDPNIGTITAQDGKVIKPLVALNIIDQDSMLNLNAIGDRLQAKVADFWRSRDVGIMSSTVTHPLSQGFGVGPADISARFLFDEDNDYKDIFDFRYGRDGAPGSSVRDDISNLWARNRVLAPRHFTDGTTYAVGLPIGVHGYAPVDIDLQGNLVTRFQQVNDANGNHLTDEFGIADPYKATGGATPVTADEYFSFAELSRVLRRYDPDVSMLPSRLSEVLASSKLASQSVASAIEHYVTNHSVDMPYASLTERGQAASSMQDFVVGLAHRFNSQMGTTRVFTTADIASIFPFEFRANQKFDLNQRLGNGLDDTAANQRGRGLVDEPSELTAEVPEQYPDSVSRVAGYYTRDNPNNNDPVMSLFPTGATPTLSRVLYARYLYCLGQLVIPLQYQFPGMSASPPALPLSPSDRAIRARNIAQWAVNVVDFRDTDSAMTRFAYDVDPFSITGSEANVWVPQIGNVVWGMEMPELVFSEVLATHDVAVQDTYLDSTGMTMRDPSPPPSMPDDDLDQYKLPTGNLVIEMFAPRSSGAVANPDHLGVPTDLWANIGGRAVLQTNLLTPSGVDADNSGQQLPSVSVWRIAISPALSLFPGAAPPATNGHHQLLQVMTDEATPAIANSRHLWDNQITTPNRVAGGGRVALAPSLTGLYSNLTDLYSGTPNTTPILPIERIIWLANQDPTTVPNAAQFDFPELDLTMGGTATYADRIYWNRTGTQGVEGGNYLVIGSRETITFGSNSPTGNPADEIFTAEQASQAPALRNVVRYLPSSQRITLGAGGVTTSDFGGTSRNKPNVRGASWMVAAANVRNTPPNDWTDAYPIGPGQSGQGINISLPTPDQLASVASPYRLPTTIINTDGAAGFPALPIDSYADVNSPGSGQFPDEPFDINNPHLQIPETSFQTEDFSGATIANARMIYLQRVADPSRPYHPVWNPYIVVDAMPVDLTVFSGERAENGGSIAFSTRERTGFDAATATASARLANVPPTNTILTPYSYKTYSLADRPGTGPETTENHPTRGAAFFGHLLGVGNLADPVNRVTTVVPTIGFLNDAFGDPAAGVSTPNESPVFVGRSPNVMANITWFNRDFSTSSELLLVPRSSSGKLNQQFTSFRAPVLPQAIDSLSLRPTDIDTPFGHLWSFFESSKLSPVVHGRDLFKLLAMVETPSRFANTRRLIEPTVFGNNPVLLGTYRAPFNFIPTMREPGKVNVNTVARELVWKGVEWNYHAPELQWNSSTMQWEYDTNNVTPTKWWRALKRSRQVYDNPSGGGHVNPNYPSEFTGAFRGPNSSYVNAYGNSLRSDFTEPLNVGFARKKVNPDIVDPNAPTFIEESSILFSDSTLAGLRSDAFSVYRPLMRLPNLVTTHSNVFAVRMTIGFFEVDPVTGLGNEHVEANGEPKRHHSLYFIDRSVPVGYITGEDLNSANTIIFKQFIE